VIQLRSRLTDKQNTDLGKVVLHRLSQVDGYTISVTSALAPDKAKKAFEKGLDRESKEKWSEARESLEKAVEIYPKYAAAWYELGRLQTRSQNTEGARRSFNQALEADPKYLNPYRGLALLALSESRWQELVDSSGKLVELSPSGFPDGWFLNAVGQYYLQNFEAAEKSARQGIEVDGDHKVPKLEYILGMTLMREHDYQQAGEHMRRYLYLSITSTDLEEARKQLAEIQRVTTTASAPVAEEKK
jgi:tetratricopeptide (TPR) repeat protein